MKKLLIVLLGLALNLFAYSQEDKPVSIVVSGTGKTSEEAKSNALSSAIEQTYGAYVSAKTEVLNDSLISSEIVSISSGNIISYKVLHETESDELHNVLIEANVSVNKLITFAQAKGFEIQVNGSGFAANLKQQRLNEKAEIIAIRNSLTAALGILHSGFDYELETKEPILSDQLNSLWTVETIVTSRANENFSKAQDIVRSLLNDISLSEKEVEQYRATGKPVYEIKYHDLEFDEPFLYYLRTSEGLWAFIRFAYKIPVLSLRYKLTDGIKYEYNGLLSHLDKNCDVTLSQEIKNMVYQYFFYGSSYGIQSTNGGEVNSIFENLVHCEKTKSSKCSDTFSRQYSLKKKLYPLDPYYFHAPFTGVKRLDYYNSVEYGYQPDLSTCNFKLIYSEAELANLTKFTCAPLLITESPCDYDLKSYVDISIPYEKDKLPKRTDTDSAIKSLYTIHSNRDSLLLTIDIESENRTILTNKLEKYVETLRSEGYKLEEGRYDIYFSCIIRADGSISLRPITEFVIVFYPKKDMVDYMAFGGRKNKGDVLTEEEKCLRIWQWIKEKTELISDYPPPLSQIQSPKYPSGGPQIKTDCYRSFHFTFYID